MIQTETNLKCGPRDCIVCPNKVSVPLEKKRPPPRKLINTLKGDPDRLQTTRSIKGSSGPKHLESSGMKGIYAKQQLDG